MKSNSNGSENCAEQDISTDSPAAKIRAYEDRQRIAELDGWFRENSPNSCGYSRRSFYKRFKECVSCRESLNQQYETAVIVDDNLAACENCAQAIAGDNLKLYAGG